jgi:uncharacterized membrane protein YciS (DUF1049 family)
MKGILVILMVLNFAITLAAQQKQLQTKNLDAFTGVWEYKTANELFRIVFIKGKCESTSFKFDCVIGGYLHIKNGVTIGDYTKNIPVKYTYDNRKDVTIIGDNAHIDLAQILPNSIRLSFTDRKIGKTTTGFHLYRNNLTLLSPTEARFQLFEDEGDGLEVPDGFSVPTNVIMKKVVPAKKWNFPEAITFIEMKVKRSLTVGLLSLFAQACCFLQVT